MLFELADYLGFTAALLGGLLVDRRMRPQPPAPLKPICTCEHGYGTHADGKGCQAKELTKYDAFDNKRLEPCPCLRYDGPDPAIFGLDAR